MFSKTHMHILSYLIQILNSQMLIFSIKHVMYKWFLLPWLFKLNLRTHGFDFTPAHSLSCSRWVVWEKLVKTRFPFLCNFIYILPCLFSIFISWKYGYLTRNKTRSKHINNFYFLKRCAKLKITLFSMVYLLNVGK